MQAKIKIVHESKNMMAKNGVPFRTVWTVIEIDGIEFRRLFHIFDNKEKTGTKEKP